MAVAVDTRGMKPLMGVSQRLKIRDAKVIGDLAKALREAPFDEAGSDGQRGITQALMNTALGSLDGAVAAAVQGSDLSAQDISRHVFTWLLTGQETAKQFTGSQLRILFEWFSVEANQEAARQAIITAVQSGIHPGTTEVSMYTQTQHPTEQSVPAPAAPEVPENPGAVVASLGTHAEAILSASARLYDQNGIDWLVTVRAGADGRSFVSFLEVLQSAGAYAMDHGFAVANPRAVQLPAPTPVVHQPATLPAAASSPTPAPANENGEQAFAAAELVGNVTNGKTYWKVKGGVFGQYGITVWPEVLQAAGLSDLNPMQPYNLQGWTAHWSQDDQGRKKVTRLVH